MNKFLSKIVAFTFTLLLATTLTFAAEKKDPPKMGPPPTIKEAKQSVKAELVDINTATEAELKAIPGIGDAYAKKIIAGRPYAKKDQLKAKNIVPGAVYEKIKDKIVAKQAKK